MKGVLFLKRYGFLWMIAILLIGTMAACSDDSSSSSDGSGGEGKIELFSWWTAGGESEGLNALMDQFKEEHPDIEIENAAVAGGGGSNAKAVLANRMQGGDPPSTFQVHGGDELLAGWVAADKMQPLNDLYEKNNWKEVFPQELIDMVSKDGNIYAVPVDVHRGNVVFYNKSVFEENNIEPPKANLGAEGYNKLWNGEIPMDDERVVKSAEMFKKVLGYVNEDHSARAWQDGSQLVADGKAAMNIMGDWANGYYKSKDLKPGEDYGWFASPGTEGEFQVITDTFGLPKGVENPDQVKEFLTVLGSKKGQDAFNPLKGSIPARTDTDMSKYGEYSTDTIKDFKEAKLTPSLAHGSAAPEQVVTKVNQAVNVFVTQQKVDQFIESLKQSVSSLK